MWKQVSWTDLEGLCRRLAMQIQVSGRPQVVLALARAGYVPGAILASLLRCDLVTIRVPPGGAMGRLAAGSHALAWLRPQVAGRRVVVLDELTLTGESLAWAARAAQAAGASEVQTAALVRLPGSPLPDFHAVESSAHIVQPWIHLLGTVDATDRVKN